MLPWDYFLTDYERDLLTLTLKEGLVKIQDKTADELKTEIEKMRERQYVFEEKS